MPLENPAELNAKIKRVSNMASDLHFMKKQFREHIMNKNSISLAERNLKIRNQRIVNGLLKTGPKRTLSEMNDSTDILSPVYEARSNLQHSKIIQNDKSINIQNQKFGTKRDLHLIEQRQQNNGEEMMQIDRMKINKEQVVAEIGYESKDKIKVMQQCDQMLNNIVKSKLNKLESSVEPRLREYFKLNSISDQAQFQKDYYKVDQIIDVMDKDVDFKQQMRTTKAETQQFLNGVFHSLERHNNKLKVENAFSNFNKELNEFNSPRQSKVEVYSSASRRHLIINKPNFRGAVLRSMTDGTHFKQEVDKRQKMNLMFVVPIKQFSDCLVHLFKEKDMGEVYKESNQNLFRNIYLENLQKIKHGIDLNLIGSKEKRENMENIDQYFTDQVSKKKFYDQAKDGKLALKFSKEQKLLLEYYQTLRDKLNLPLPHYSQSPLMMSNTIFLNEVNINNVQAQAMNQFFQKSKGIEQMKIRDIIFNNNGLKDEDFAKILEGINIQNNLNDTEGLDLRQREQQGHVQRLLYYNNQLGRLSLNQIINILPPLLDLQIVDNGRSITKEIMQALTSTIIQNGKRLMKIKFSKINMNDKEIINNLCEYIGTNVSLNAIELSWCQLKADNLLSLAEIMAAHPYSISMVNFSYNSLNINSRSKEIDESQNSINFISKFLEFVKNSEALNHVDFSGLFQFQCSQYDLGDQSGNSKVRDEIAKLAHGLSASQLLLGIHLSDNGIMLNENLCYKIMDIFGIPKEDLKVEAQETVGNIEIKRKVNELTYQARRNNFRNENVEIDNLEYQKHLIESKQTKALNQQKMINDICLNQGIGCSKENRDDLFILNRNVNNPELVFNQRIANPNYFEQDASLKWRLASNECFVCNKHSYVAICYEQATDDNKNKNQGLLEIKDPEFLKKLPEYLGLNIKDVNRIRPVITGTVLHGGWKKNLMMLRSELYASACISQSKKFVHNISSVKQIKKGVVVYAEKNQNITEEDVIRKTNGWNNIVNDKFNNNYLTDVNVVNEFPNIELGPPANTSFIYAAYLKPGHHQFLIYCPKTRRAFFQHIIVQLNTCDNYPEFPKIVEAYKIKKPSQNVWRNWIEDNEQSLNITYNNDISYESFNIDQLIKDPEQRRNIYKILLDNFDLIQTYFIELNVLSSSYPKIDFLTIVTALEEISSQKEVERGKSELSRSIIGLQFQAAMRNKNDFKGALNRAQLLEMIIRCAYQVYGRENLSDNLGSFFNHYIKPVIDKSKIKQKRLDIRKNQKLNDLLVLNETDLARIYYDYSENKRGDFTYISAKKLLNSMEDHGTLVEPATLKSCFIYSEMTVQHEASKRKKYKYLYYVEFLELLCRVAPYIPQNACYLSQTHTPVDVKVKNLLKVIFDYRQKEGLAFDQECLREPDVDSDSVSNSESENEIKEEVEVENSDLLSRRTLLSADGTGERLTSAQLKTYQEDEEPETQD